MDLFCYNWVVFQKFMLSKIEVQKAVLQDILKLHGLKLADSTWVKLKFAVAAFDAAKAGLSCYIAKLFTFECNSRLFECF